jgi:septin 7
MASKRTSGSSTEIQTADDPTARRSVSLGPSDSPSEMARKLAQLIRRSEDANHPTAVDANGVPAPTRASPTPNIPNGKATSPYVERSNPMGQGATQTVSSKDPKAAALAASDMRNVVRRKLTGYVGFANLPNQWHRKSVRKGFNFNVMVVG